MKVIESIKEMKEASQALRAEGKKIAFVPTMGYLHEGHLSLMRKGREVGDALIVSIFVNPTQFGKGEDLERYPRDIERDKELCKGEGVDILFVPSVREIYPENYQTYVDVEDVTKNLCGTSRPGHFRGVATVVTKLFNIVRPDIAIFGEKDFQQLAVIKRLALDLNMDVEVIGMPIFRESDGLAMSSRNNYLSQEERGAARSIYRALRRAKEVFDEGERSAGVLLNEARRVLEICPLIEPEYVKLADMGTMEYVDRVEEEALLAIAVRIGKTRLIDNIILRKM
ncbi:MAG: pantoate--beta-alanine ligase [Deltaproteobacteria bacterium]|nr:pantoate--beta-alanine ligase [Deltaproteobacteria bacterium]